MTKKLPVSGLQNIWFDAQQVGDADLSLEQDYNNNTNASVINNQFGAGVVPQVLNQNVLFDSSLVVGLLDGINIQPQNQPADKNYGNQLEVELTGSKVFGHRGIKVAIIGLDFNGNLQYDTFHFRLNEKQYTKKHYTNILLILFNDMLGTSTQSFNLGGRVVIREAKPLLMSRDTVMISQDIEPNLFWRDFYTSSSSLSALLKSSLPLYNTDNLNIYIGYRDNKSILKNDVSTQVGQKFLAKTNNIQKIQLLLSVENTDPGMSADLAWHGDLLVSVYSLQTSVQSPSDIAPNSAIDFSPNNVPIAQLSFNYTTLQQNGFILDGNPQPIDFVFSNTSTASGASIIPGNYYIVTVKRSGSADKCNILITAGSNRTPNTKASIFNGTTWVDIPEEDLWFRVHTDAVKVSDGQAYDTGNGIVVQKTFVDPTTQATIDYSFDAVQFAGTDTYTGVLTATTQKSVLVQDQRTGNPIYSRKSFAPTLQLLNTIDFGSLTKSSEPLVIGTISDKNQKGFDSSTSTFSAALHEFTFANNEITLKVITDTSDPRYDPNVVSLVSNLLNGDLIDAKIIPNSTYPSTYYRISKAQLFTMLYGDVNGDGVIDENDLTLINTLYGTNLNVAPSLDGYRAYDGYTFDGYRIFNATNGYNSLTKPFLNDTGLTYKIVNKLTNGILYDGYLVNDGYLLAGSLDGSTATFAAPSIASFNSLLSIYYSNYNLIINTATYSQNRGVYQITGLDPVYNTITISKVIYNSEKFMQIFRSSIVDGYTVSSQDGYYLQNYINKLGTIPPTTQPSLKIGTQFNAIVLTVEPFLDRADDFYQSLLTRSATLHATSDVYLDGYSYFQNNNFLSTPITFTITKQLVWKDYLVYANPFPRFMPTAFTTGLGLNDKSIPAALPAFPQLVLPGQEAGVLYPVVQPFDPGRIDSYIPNDLIIGNQGELRRSDGNYYKVDFEIGTIVLEIPLGLTGEKSFNIFDNFVSNYSNGLTRKGFQAMRFADGSFVGPDALSRNQLRFAVSIQSFSPNENTVSTIDGYTGIIIDPKMGVSVDQTTGIVKLNFTNLYQDLILQSLDTKVQVQVMLKKAGFNNPPVFISSTKMTNLLS